jgi:hypothetical protein
MKPIWIVLGIPLLLFDIYFAWSWQYAISVHLIGDCVGCGPSGNTILLLWFLIIVTIWWIYKIAQHIGRYINEKRLKK